MKINVGTSTGTIQNLDKGIRPRKASRAGFDAAYWTGGDPATIPESTKRRFYSDYLTSTHTLKKYISNNIGWE